MDEPPRGHGAREVETDVARELTPKVVRGEGLPVLVRGSEFKSMDNKVMGCDVSGFE